MPLVSLFSVSFPPGVIEMLSSTAFDGETTGDGPIESDFGVGIDGIGRYIVIFSGIGGCRESNVEVGSRVSTSMEEDGDPPGLVVTVKSAGSVEVSAT